jgi:hypothetical protein
MDEHALLERVNAAKREFGARCKKYVGAVTVELIKRALQENGINTSPCDVFIKGLPIEIDLLIPKAGIEPENGILYRPEDVLVVLEIKHYGAYGEEAVRRIRENFQAIQRCNKEIRCLYITLSERRGYKWAVTEDEDSLGYLGHPAFILFWRSGSGKKEKWESPGDWQRLVDTIAPVLAEAASLQ